jgi:hypothetical protein
MAGHDESLEGLPEGVSRQSVAALHANPKAPLSEGGGHWLRGWLDHSYGGFIQRVTIRLHT